MFLFTIFSLVALLHTCFASGIMPHVDGTTKWTPNSLQNLYWTINWPEYESEQSGRLSKLCVQLCSGPDENALVRQTLFGGLNVFDGHVEFVVPEVPYNPMDAKQGYFLKLIGLDEEGQTLDEFVSYSMRFQFETVGNPNVTGDAGSSASPSNSTVNEGNEQPDKENAEKQEKRVRFADPLIQPGINASYNRGLSGSSGANQGQKEDELWRLDATKAENERVVDNRPKKRFFFFSGASKTVGGSWVVVLGSMFMLFCRF